jgi:hypothetical protein
MLDRYEIWHAVVGLLLVILARQDPRLSARFPLRAALAAAAGLFLPLVDYARALGASADSIEFLIRPRPLHSLATGLLLISALAIPASILWGRRRGLALCGWIAAGFLAHLLLDGLTEAGLWLGPASASERRDWPAFAEGHLTLALLLALAWGAARALPRHRGRVLAWAWALGGTYLAVGLAQYAVISARADPGEDVLPANPWRTRWIAVRTEEQDVTARALGMLGTPLGDPVEAPRWNDEARLLEMVADPVARRFYFQVFRNPVVRVDSRGQELTLALREAAWLDAEEPGPRFTLVWASDGRERVYHVEGFR